MAFRADGPAIAETPRRFRGYDRVMSELTGFSIPFARLTGGSPRTTYVLHRKALDRILAFTGRTIDDVVNSPIVKNQVIGYYKLHKWIDRAGEVSELERQWNPLK